VEEEHVVIGRRPRSWPLLVRSVVAAATVLVLTAAVASAQRSGLPGTSAPAEPAPPAAPSTSDDSVVYADSTPRGAVFNFLAEGRRANYIAAAKRLDLSALPEAERAQAGPALARQLKVVLDRALWFDVEKLSDRPDGDRDDGLPASVERLGSIDSERGSISVTLRRSRGIDGTQVWLFPPTLVGQIPELYDEFGYGWIGNHFPDRMHRMGIGNLERWQAIVLLVVLMLAWLAGVAVTFVLWRLARPMVARTRWRVDDQLFDTMRMPIRFAFAVGFFAAALSVLRLTIGAERWIHQVLSAVAFIIIVLMVSAIVDAFALAARERLERDGERAGAGVVRFVNGILKGLLAVVATIGVLQALGFNVTSLLAGLGIGGIAVALAAQKTLENLLGGVALMTDKPVKVGEVCKFGDKAGVVEEFGFRSTRVRTFDRSLVSIPNGVFSNMEIENLSARTRLRFYTTLRLRPETSPDQVRAVLVGIRELLIGHPRLAPDGLWARLTSMDGPSWSIEMQAYVNSGDWEEFLGIREDLLLRIIDIIAANGSGLAFQSQSIYQAPDISVDEEAGRAAEERIRSLRATGRLPFPDFPPEDKLALADRIDYPPEGSPSALPPVIAT
jgi:MscS family membrane protein